MQSIANPHPAGMTRRQQIALALGTLGLLALLITWAGGPVVQPALSLTAALLLMAGGTIWYAHEAYRLSPPGIKNNGLMFSGIATRGVLGWVAGVLISGFYVCLYWYPEYLTGLIQLFDPLSMGLNGKPASQWFVYGTLYTFAVLVFGVRFLFKYRHNRYQQIRTLSVMFFQLLFSFLIPAWLVFLNEPEFYFTYFWPLKMEYFTPYKFMDLMHHPGKLAVFMLFWSTVVSFIAVPTLTYFFGKRWYCSWVCGCGALAETAGDPFRTLSDKSLRAWKIERYLIYSVLVFVTIATLLLWANSWYKGEILGTWTQNVNKTYGFLISSMFAGVIGTGFYPILGSRGWCRFGCPQAAILGILQRYFSRFRITVNGGQCISCGNCSTYCEMGIDVKAYAQRGQDVVRASCVGCGICSAVCPRGVLRLENGLDISERGVALRTAVFNDQ